MSIKQEDEKPEALKTPGLKENLEKSKNAYMSQKSILDEALKSGQAIEIGPEEIKELQKDLESMKHFGESIKKVGVKIQKSKVDDYQFRYGTVPPPPKKRGMIERGMAFIKKEDEKPESLKTPGPGEVV